MFLISLLEYSVALTVLSISVAALQTISPVRQITFPGQRQNLRPPHFTIDTECEGYLKNIQDTLIYNYGVNDDEPYSGASQVACLDDDSPAASLARKNVKKILVALPTLHEIEGWNIFTLFQMKEALGLKPDDVIFPCSPDGRAIRLSFMEIVKAKNQVAYMGDPARCYPILMDGAFTPSVECAQRQLTVSVDHGQPGHRDIVNTVYHILTSCSEMRKLDLSITQEGCVVSSSQYAFPWWRDDVFPDLEELRLSGYDFETDGLGLYQELSGYEFIAPERRGQMERFVSATHGLRNLRRLDIDYPPAVFLHHFPYPRLKKMKLESLTFRPKIARGGPELTICGTSEEARKMRKRYEDWIIALPPLRELRLSGLDSRMNMTAILERHGETLESLSLHDHEEATCDEQYPAEKRFGRASCHSNCVNRIRALAPGLKKLELDLERFPVHSPALECRKSNRGPCRYVDWEAIRSISKFKLLQEVTIHIDLFQLVLTKMSKDCPEWKVKECPECCRIRVPLEPKLSVDFVKMVFDEAFKDIGLETLTLVAGDFGKKESFGAGMMEFSDQARPSKVKCWRIMRGDDILCHEASGLGDDMWQSELEEAE